MANCSGFRTALGLIAVVGIAAAASAQQADTRSSGPVHRAGQTGTVQTNIKQAPAGSTSAYRGLDPKAALIVPRGGNCADACGAATILDIGANPFDLTGFTNDFAGTCGATGTAADGWWTFTAVQDGTLTATTCGGTGLDTVLSWLSACGGPVINCLDDFCGLQTTLSTNVVTGNTYKLRIAGFAGGIGSGTLTASFTPAAPCNNFDCCAQALAVTDGATPYNATGATTDGSMTCGFNVGNDVWFRYTAVETGTRVVTTCDPSRTYDTVMTVYDGGCGSPALGCNDDGPPFCANPPAGFSGSTVTIPTVVGQQYTIQVGCYNSGPAGASALHIDPPPPPCELSPPPGGADEGEPCGSDTNGGCNSCCYTPIACGGSVNGLAWASGGTRDTDWFEFSVADRTTITYRGQAQFPLQLFILDGNCPPTILAAASGVNPCDIVEVSADVCPGTVHLFAGTVDFDGTPCGANNGYWVQLVSCTPVGGTPPPNDDCNNATVVSIPSVNPFDTSAACNDFAASCGASAASPDVWYTFTAPIDGRVVVSTCNLSASDTVLGLLGGCAGPELICLDDFCGLQTEICGPVSAGVQYWVRVSGFAGQAVSGDVSIDVVNSTFSIPPGAVDENEPCGSDTNGGCNSVPPIFGTIATDGTPISGIAWASGGTRDTDWYSYTVGAPTSMTYMGAAEFPLRLFILDGNCPPAILATALGGCTGEASVTADVPAGTNNVFAGTNDFDGTPCGGNNRYWIRLFAGEPCTGITIPPGAIDENETCGGDTNGGCNATPNAWMDIACNVTVHGTSQAAAGTRDTDWYRFTAPASGSVSITASSDFSAVYFILEIIGTDPCGTINLLATGCTGCGDTTTVSAGGLTPGTTYYFFASTGTCDAGIFDGVPCPANYVATFDIGCTGNPCPCNWNGDAFLNSQDFFDFIACFFTVGCDSDYNNDTFFNSQDFFDFLACFFAPPPGCP